MRRDTLFTIGHSTHPIDDFVELLERHSISCVADVRSAPYSRRNPQFNRETLRDSLKEHGFAYVWLGRELGARTEHEDCYVDGRVSFEQLSRTSSFREAIGRLLDGNETYTIALMCAEKEPLNCHRTILVARHLEAIGVPIEHILATGKSEPHAATVSRMIDLVGLERKDLFLSNDEIVDRAYRLREETVAYRDPAKADRRQ